MLGLFFVIKCYWVFFLEQWIEPTVFWLLPLGQNFKLLHYASNKKKIVKVKMDKKNNFFLFCQHF